MSNKRQVPFNNGKATRWEATRSTGAATEREVERIGRRVPREGNPSPGEVAAGVDRTSASGSLKNSSRQTDIQGEAARSTGSFNRDARPSPFRLRAFKGSDIADVNALRALIFCKVFTAPTVTRILADCCSQRTQRSSSPEPRLSTKHSLQFATSTKSV